MGKKIPLWQTILVMLVMIGLLVWSIVKDTGEMGLPGAGYPRIDQPVHAGDPHSCNPRRDHRFLDGSRYNSFHDVLWN